ncbi:metalloregulator ArsR/SmtB family transcription factor [Paucibacter sp. AS339]|uniref:helix-turn-helix transcriptional regulator n=1 Tax=Paucibacter hankyongi TaxID=3133434 RepID=UPI0030A49265
MRQTADQLLYQLKSRGPQPASALAGACAITPMGAHKQLQALLEQGLVEFSEAAVGVGRPSRIWRLTAAGHGRFPDRHGELSIQLIRQLRQTMGPQALDQLIAAREDENFQQYQARLEGLGSLAERVQALAAQRAEEGYMARMEVDASGFLLIEDHCPICAAATECQGFCRSELSLFQRCLGEQVTVTRSEHQLAGARRCVYRIEPGRS